MMTDLCIPEVKKESGIQFFSILRPVPKPSRHRPQLEPQNTVTDSWQSCYAVT